MWEARLGRAYQIIFAKDSQSRLLAVRERLTKNTYQPKPIRRVLIPKPGSKEKRPLGIPTVIGHAE